VIFHTADPPAGPVLLRTRAVPKGSVDELSAALAAVVKESPPRPECEPPDIVVLQTLLAARDDSPLVVLNPDGEIMFANLAAAALYGFPFPARRRRFEQLNALDNSGGRREPGTLPFAQVLETGLPVEDQVGLRQRDGSVMTVKITGVPHRAVSGEITSVSLIARAV
jgi:PAS domain-containing protein